MDLLFAVFFRKQELIYNGFSLFKINKNVNYA